MTVAFTFNARDQLVESYGLAQGVLRTERAYDDLGRLTSSTHKNDLGAVLESWSYGYDTGDCLI